MSASVVAAVAVVTAVASPVVAEATPSVVASVASAGGSETSPSAVVRAVTVVAAVVAVSHTSVAAVSASAVSPVASVIPAVSAVVVPAVSAAVGHVEVGASEVEEVAVGIAGIDAEVPVASAPVERTVEIGGGQVGLILPVPEYVAQVGIASRPVDTVEVVYCVDAHQVVEIDLVGCFILLVGQVELVCHLVGQEQCLLTCLLVTHGVGREGEGEQGGECYQKLLHDCIVLNGFLLFSVCCDLDRRCWP